MFSLEVWKTSIINAYKNDNLFSNAKFKLDKNILFEDRLIVFIQDLNYNKLNMYKVLR